MEVISELKASSFISIKTSHIKETKNKAEEKQVKRTMQCGVEGEEKPKDRALNLLQVLTIQIQTIWILYIFFFLHENGKNPEYTITYSAGEALLSHH